MTNFTTICKDKYGRYYDLRYEHPSWEEKKKGYSSCMVVNAFTCSVEKANQLTGRDKMKKKVIVVPKEEYLEYQEREGENLRTRVKDLMNQIVKAIRRDLNEPDTNETE